MTEATSEAVENTTKQSELEINLRKKSLKEYIEYKRIVGNDDNGVMFTPEQYEEYKKRVFPIRLNNRLYVTWVNSKDAECAIIGPDTHCRCHHRYNEHKTDFEVIPDTRPIMVPCGVKDCQCDCFHYAAKAGRMFARCSCRHKPEEHELFQPYKCLQGNCACTGFGASVLCSCKEKAFLHKTLIETKEERMNRGRPVGMNTYYKAMGGLNFGSLANFH